MKFAIRLDRQCSRGPRSVAATVGREDQPERPPFDAGQIGVLADCPLDRRHAEEDGLFGFDRNRSCLADANAVELARIDIFGFLQVADPPRTRTAKKTGRRKSNTRGYSTERSRSPIESSPCCHTKGLLGRSGSADFRGCGHRREDY